MGRNLNYWCYPVIFTAFIGELVKCSGGKTYSIWWYLMNFDPESKRSFAGGKQGAWLFGSQVVCWCEMSQQITREPDTMCYENWVIGYSVNCQSNHLHSPYSAFILLLWVETSHIHILLSCHILCTPIYFYLSSFFCSPTNLSLLGLWGDCPKTNHKTEERPERPRYRGGK